MTITVTDIVAGPFTGTGVAAALPFSFKVFTPPEIEVYTLSGGVETIISPLDYTVTINRDPAGAVLEGGSVLYAGASGAAIYLRAKPLDEQAQVWTNEGTRQSNLNESLDRAALRDLRSKLDTGKAIAVVAASVTEALENGITNISGSFARFPDDAKNYTAEGGETTLEMLEAVSNAKLVSVWRNNVAQVPGVDFTVDGSSLLTLIPALVEGEYVRGQHTGGAASIVSTAESIVSAGRDLTPEARAARFPDLYDKAAIKLDGSNDGPGVVAAFASGPVYSLAQGELRITTNTTIPAGTMLQHSNDATIYVAAGITLRIDGVFNARPDCYIFTGPGSVVGLDLVYPEWFGAVGDYDDSLPDGGGATDNTDAMNAAIACVMGAGAGTGSTRLPTVQCLDRIYGIAGEVLIEPSLTECIQFQGAGWSLFGSGTRFYSMGFGGKIKVNGRFGLDDINANSEWRLCGFSIFPSDEPAFIGLEICGEGGASNKVLSGLTYNEICNVTVSNFLVDLSIKSAFKIKVSRSYFNSNIFYGTSVLIGLSAGGADASEIVLDNVVMGQPVAGAGTGGTCLRIENNEIGVGSPAVAGLKAISLLNDCQMYAGYLGRCCVITSKGAVGKTRTTGDILFGQGTKFQGDASFTTGNGLYVESIDGAKTSSIKVVNCQLESCLGNAIDMRRFQTAGVLGIIHDVQITGNHFRYHVNRSIYLDGVSAAQILNNNFPYCGAATGAVVDHHIYVTNCISPRVENNITSARDASWPGHAIGVKGLVGTGANMLSRANAMGTATATTGITDTGSVIAQVAVEA